MDFNNQNNQNSQNNQYYDQNSTSVDQVPTEQPAAGTDDMWNTNYYSGKGEYTGANVIIQKDRHLAGLFGALVGALLGSVVWILIGLAGYVAALAAALIFFLAKTGYNLINKKMDKFGVVTCAVVGFLVVFPASTACYAFQLCQALNEYIGPYSYWEVITDFPFHMGIVDGLWGEFWKFILQSYFYAAIGFVITCVDFGKKK